MYPELYRKTTENIKGSNEKTPGPFNIGYIREIFTITSKGEDIIKLRVNKFYRPENTYLARNKKSLFHDLNLLYWSSEGTYFILPYFLIMFSFILILIHF